MKHKQKKIIIVSILLVVISITTVYAATIISSSDVTYDNSKSKSPANNVQGAIDDLYTKVGSGGSQQNLINENMITYVTNLAKTDTTNLAYDDTTDKNLRYIGENPNNYVSFNGELWRIIGVMNNIKDSSGTSASRIKLIRAESIGNLSWDNQSPNGVNDWNNSRLMTTLNNGPYWNRNSGTCYAGYKDITTNCNFSDTGLTEDAKKMLSKVLWNLGGISNLQLVTNEYYINERGSTVYSSNKSNWTGYIGLIYPSDYGYAVGSQKRDTCLKTNLSNYSTNDCFINDWLYVNATQPTITPFASTNYDVLHTNYLGAVSYTSAYSPAIVRPVVYLDTKLYITKGEGTSTNPYIISFEKEIVKTNDTSNASAPKLDDNGKLLPVTLADDGKVTYVSEDEDWYNYNEQRWANAVILVDSPSKTYSVGDEIEEADIESYFVWIPKYKYRLWNTGTASKSAHTIDIIFDTTDTTDVEGKSCKTPMTSGGTENCNNGEYMTHPAFISLGVNGFWVGKFETGYKGATTTAKAEVNSSDSSKIIIKPNVFSWRNSTIYNFFLSAYNYKRDLDSHMMKSTEWGAVAYLSHSKYGINNEVNINNSSSFKTGYSALLTTDHHTYPGTAGDGASYNQPYNTIIGYLASTTGNITGVYDMSGGAYEYMASHISGKLGSSGFTTATLANYDAKYFDVYNANSAVNTYQYRILGDATGEMGPFKQYLDGDNKSRRHGSWYDNHSDFVESTSPWINRSGGRAMGSLAGQFLFDGETGAVFDNTSSRLVLSP